MESEKEWQFITNEIQNKTGSQYNEWFIGLKENSKTQRWNWINGKSLTIDKWYKEGNNPDPADSYWLIFQEYPKGFKGTFGTFRADLRRVETLPSLSFIFPIPILLFPKAAYLDHLTTDSPSTSVE